MLSEMLKELSGLLVKYYKNILRAQSQFGVTPEFVFQPLTI